MFMALMFEKAGSVHTDLVDRKAPLKAGTPGQHARRKGLSATSSDVLT
jgi:hypothetical protein